MNVAVVGAGAIGSTVAAYLHKAGVDVTLIGRASQVDVIKENGLKISGVRGQEVFYLPVDTELREEFSLVIFTTKTQDVTDACRANYDFLEHSIILTTQNGVQSDSMISVHVEKEKVISSIVMFGATYVKEGEIVFNFEGDWIIGKPYMPNGMIVEDVSKMLSKAFSVIITDDIVGMKWLKLFVNFNNCIPALVGKSMQETFADMDLCRLSIRLLKEGIDIVSRARIELVSLPNFPVDRIYGLSKMPEDQAAGIINQTLTTLSKEPLYGSILQSIIRKKKSEIEFINGEVDVLSKQIGTRAPLNRKVVDLVNQVEQSGKFFTFDEVKKEFGL
ncbi:MAG: 2-dehydropantoate 2-reductase [Candidatus Omnitrophica bacterium]|nr:2-dehydropantoate 2-reductase [Candidatus Omnitrophota bacterium]